VIGLEYSGATFIDPDENKDIALSQSATITNLIHREVSRATNRLQTFTEISDRLIPGVLRFSSR